MQLSGLPTKVENNLTFLVDRLNFVQASASPPEHISFLCLWTVRKAVQFILLVNDSGCITPVTLSVSLIPTLPEIPCLGHLGPFPTLPHPCLFSCHILSFLLLLVRSSQTYLPSPVPAHAESPKHFDGFSIHARGEQWLRGVPKK